MVRVGLTEKMTLEQRNDRDETVWQAATGKGQARQRGQGGRNRECVGVREKEKTYVLKDTVTVFLP